MDYSVLNREQRKAVETLAGPVLILAGAGSGKTRALTYRIANLLEHGVAAEQILALTFTNKAAREMRERVAKLTNESVIQAAWIGTFHSICARILRRDIEKLGYSRNFVIFDDDDQNRMMKEIYKTLNIDEAFIPPREVRIKISDAKNKMRTPDEWFAKSARDRRSSLIHDIMTEYEKRMKAMNALDFDDLLLKTLELFAEHPPVLQYYRRRFAHVLVDEYQDTNKVQYEMVQALTAQSRNLCVVGDDDQSIYGWRGADLHNILDFEKDFPDAVVIRLEQNYRSTANILDAANQVIAHNAERKDKKLWTEEGAGEKIHIYTASDEHNESLWMARKIEELKKNGEDYSSIAILYRTNAQSRLPEEMLMHSGIPYKVFGGQKFYERKEIKDILAYLRVIVNPADDIALGRIINVPKRAIGDTTVQALTEHAARNGMPLFSALNDLPEGLSSRARNSIGNFFQMMTLLSAMKECLELEDFIGTVIEKTGLEAQYLAEKTDEARDRIENIREFRNGVHEYCLGAEKPTLEDYLENVALVTDLDAEGENRGYVTMMTLHSAKGLEFGNVFIPGMEEDIFPSYRSMTEENRLEEERRLMYVGITRARKRLFLSHARERMLFNQYKHNPPSRFLNEIPERLKDESSYFREERAQSWFAVPKKNEKPPEKLPGVNRFMKVPEITKPTIKGRPLDSIPGVSKGFAASKIHEVSAAADSLFAAGDRVQHPKFGKGTVTSVSGSGAAGRISITFESCGEKTLALGIAPLVKISEEDA